MLKFLAFVQSPEQHQVDRCDGELFIAATFTGRMTDKCQQVQPVGVANKQFL